VLALAHTEAGHQRLERHLLHGGVDGVLVMSGRAGDPLPGRLAEAGIPTVVAGRPPDGVAVGYVDADNVGGACRAVRLLIERGRRRIGTVAGPPDMVPGVDRRTGWEKALVAAGRAPDPDLVAAADFTRAGGEAATRRAPPSGPPRLSPGPGGRRPPAGSSSGTPTSTGCSSPPTSGRSAPSTRSGRPAGGCPTTSASSDSTTPSWPGRPTRRSPP